MNENRGMELQGWVKSILCGAREWSDWHAFSWFAVGNEKMLLKWRASVQSLSKRSCISACQISAYCGMQCNHGSSAQMGFPLLKILLSYSVRDYMVQNVSRCINHLNLADRVVRKVLHAIRHRVHTYHFCLLSVYWFFFSRCEALLLKRFSKRSSILKHIDRFIFFAKICS